MKPSRARSSSTVVADVGESGLIDLVKERFGAGPEGELWAGDDTAIIATGRRTLFTTDVIVEGVDFDLSYCTGFDVGWKSLAVNVSDVAAMGGVPRRAVVALSMAPETPMNEVTGLLDGLDACARAYAVGIVGGDVSGADRMSVSVALTGDVDTPVLRSGARPGDEICVTGTLGGAAAGLFALQRKLEGHNAAIDRLIARQLRPKPRLPESRRLLGASAMIDVSDGLALDLSRVMAASGTGCEVELGLLPVDPDLLALDGGTDPVALALGGGEDYELLCTIDPSDLDATVAALSGSLTGLTRIGVVTEGESCLFDGEPLEEEEMGWDHLRSR
jgi:thiamine-monophosphate kinase